MDSTNTMELAKVPAVATQTASELSSQAAGLLELAQAYVVDSPEMYALAGEELRTIATRKAKLTETRLGITRPMDAAKKAVMDLFAQPLEVLEQAEGYLRRSMLTWKKAEDERQRKLQEEAERAERERLVKLAAEREAAEAAERRARAEAEAAMKAGDTDAFTAAAEAAEEAAAKAEEAAAEVELAEVAPRYAPAVATPKAAGVSGRQTWKAEVVSLAELVKGAAAALERGDDSLLAYLQPNTTALGQTAKALKGATRIPGVRAYAEESLAVRRR